MSEASPVASLVLLVPFFIIGPLIGYVVSKAIGASRLPSIVLGFLLAVGSVVLIFTPAKQAPLLVMTLWMTVLFGSAFAVGGYLIGKASDNKEDDPHKFAAQACLTGCLVGFVLMGLVGCLQDVQQWFN